MRKIGNHELDGIALGASLLGSGGGGDPYIGKLIAMGAIKEHGPVTLLDPSLVPIGFFDYNPYHDNREDPSGARRAWCCGVCA
jgi:hypothetical protein